MKITWLGHSGFRIEIEKAVLLIDPWLTGNPMFPKGRRAAATAGATHILATHGHGDHSADAVAIRSIGNDVPASAAAPKGDWLSRARQSAKRLRSRFAIS